MERIQVLFIVNLVSNYIENFVSLDEKVDQIKVCLKFIVLYFMIIFLNEYFLN